MNIDPEKRPSILDLINLDLFEIPQDLTDKYGKILTNVMDYYSPDNVIKDKIVIPLRKICCDILRNQETMPYDINNYQNFIFNIINELKIYMFQSDNTLTDSFDDKESVSSTNNSLQVNDEYMTDNEEYKFRHSVLVKYVVENKVIDLLIFLILRHFNTNLKLYKKKIKAENPEDTQNTPNTYSTNLYTVSSNVKFETLIDNTNAVLNTNGSLTERNTDKKYYNELNKFCGKLISSLVDFLLQCVQALDNYEHILSLYVEDVLIWIIKLFIGEENQLLGSIYDYKSSEDKLKQYILKRTFMRDENIVMNPEFEEDELDQVFNIINMNKHLIDIKSYWSPELHYFTDKLFREAFGENCSGNYSHAVIKDYFLAVNNNTNNNKVNPLSDNGFTVKKLNIPGTKYEIEIKNNFLNTEYVSEVFTIIDMMKKLSNKKQSLRKNIENRKNCLNYLNIVFKSKNSAKIRALSLVDMNEISWQFGNNYEKIYDKKNINTSSNNTTIDLENNSCVNESNWDSNTSLIDFTSNILTQPHLYMLNYSNKFLKINIQKSLSTYKAHLKQFGFIFSSPLILKPIMRSLQKRNENYYIRQTCLEILFNILLSNEIRITSNLNMTMCNFYEMLVEIISFSPSNKELTTGSKNKDDFETGDKEKYFIESVSKAIKIIIGMQNPDIKRQIFNCPMFLKYMEKNKLSFVPRLDLDEIEEEFNKIKDLLNFENLEGKNIFFN